jgi:hypothetical protein
MRIISGEISNNKYNKSYESKPKIGRPSDSIFPIFANFQRISWATFQLGPIQRDEPF